MTGRGTADGWGPSFSYPEVEDVVPLTRYLESALVVIDVGCRWGAEPKWSAFGSSVAIYGFDPDGDECQRLERESSPDTLRRYIPIALGPAASRARLHVTAEPACSSLYAPDPRVVGARQSLECAREVETTMVDLVRLDDWARSAGVRPDFIKADTQGSELGVLQGSTGILQSVRVVQVEVEFNAIYLGQPLFGDVDAFMRGQGFVLWRLGGLAHYGLPDVPPDFEYRDLQHSDTHVVEVGGHGGQLFWAEAYYVQAEMTAGGSGDDWEKGVRDGCIATALGFKDLAVRSLRGAARHSPPHVAAAICEAIGLARP